MRILIGMGLMEWKRMMKYPVLETHIQLSSGSMIQGWGEGGTETLLLNPEKALMQLLQTIRYYLLIRMDFIQGLVRGGEISSRVGQEFIKVEMNGVLM